MSALIKQTSQRIQGTTLQRFLPGLVTYWLRFASISTLAIAGLPLMATAAIAQASVSSEEITQYASAVLEMDSYRNEAYTQIKDLLLSVNMDFSQVNVSCTTEQDISKVPRSVRRQVREILVGYCNEAKDIVEANGLSPRRFNDITEAHNEDATLFERIQQELIRLQQVQ